MDDSGTDNYSEFYVYEHPLLPQRIVKNGFCWPAFFVGPCYLIYRRLWIPLVLWLICIGLLKYIVMQSYPNANFDSEDATNSEIAIAVGFLVGLMITGVAVNDLWAENLKTKGYQLIKSITARSADEVLAILAREKASQITH